MEGGVSGFGGFAGGGGVGEGVRRGFGRGYLAERWEGFLRMGESQRQGVGVGVGFGCYGVEWWGFRGGWDLGVVWMVGHGDHGDDGRGLGV